MKDKLNDWLTVNCNKIDDAMNCFWKFILIAISIPVLIGIAHLVKGE